MSDETGACVGLDFRGAVCALSVGHDGQCRGLYLCAKCRGFGEDCDSCGGRGVGIIDVALAAPMTRIRERIEDEYRHVELASGAVGGTFGEILCHELHRGGEGHGLHFGRLAEKWRVSIHTIGLLIADHCDRLPDPRLTNR